MKVRNSVRGLKVRPGSIVACKKDPRQKARQG